MQIKNNQLKKLSIQHLLEIRSHLGHKVKYIDFFSEGFVLGQIDGITVFHVDRI
jgi:ribosomal protein S2